MNKNNEQPHIRSGEKLPFLDGNNDDLFLSRAFWNKIIATAQAVLSTPQWQVTDHGIMFDTPAVAAPAAPSTDVAWFQVSSRTIGADFIQGFQVFGWVLSLDAALQNLVPIPSSVSPIPTYIAKQLNLRRGVQVETIDGVNITYTTPSFGDFDNNRTSSDGTNPQAEFAYPRYRTLAEVSALYTALGRTVVPSYAQCYVLASKPPAGSGAFAYNGSGDLNDPANYVPVDWVELSPIRDWISA